MSLLILFTLIIFSAQAGYIDTNPNSTFFVGSLKSKKAPGNLDWRTHSQIFQDYNFKRELEKIQKMKKATLISLCLDKLPRTSDCSGEIKDPLILSKWKSDIENLSLDKAARLLTEAEDIKTEDLNTVEGRAYLKNIFQSMEIMEAIKRGKVGRFKREGVEIFPYFKSLFYKTDIKVDGIEADNLFVPDEFKGNYKNQVFFSSKDLDSLKKINYDLSLLNPPDNSFWRKPDWDISTFDLTNYGGLAFYKLEKTYDSSTALRILDPANSLDLIYDPTSLLRGKVPEVIVSFQGQKWILRFPLNVEDGPRDKSIMKSFNLFFESNLINSNPVAKNMAQALGFNVSLSVFKKKVRVYFDEKSLKGKPFESARQELLNNLQTQFKGFNIRTPFKNILTDESTGEKYFDLRGVTLQKMESDKIGILDYTGIGKSLRREFRGFALFLSWIDDIGVEDLDLIYPGDTIQINDLGASFGRGFPNFLKPKIIKKINKNMRGKVTGITLDYKRLNSFPLLSTLTFSDARWMIRMIAQLTPSQIMRSFKNAGFPDLVSQIFVLKLMSRRNQLIEALNLGEEIAKEDGWKGSIAGHEKFFTKGGNLFDKELELHDPEQASFPVHWSSSWFLKKDDKLLKGRGKTLTASTLNIGLDILLKTTQFAVGFSNRNFKWTELNLERYGYGPMCDGDCYYQGIEAGPTAFIPQRIILDNPDKKSSKPFLILDFFRIAVDAHIGQGLEKILGLTPLPFTLGAGVSGFMIYEFMKIRAVEGIPEVLTDVKGLLKTPLLTFTKFKQEFVASMVEGETLVMSSYLGIQGKVLAGPPMAANILGSSIEFNAGFARTARVVVHKEKDDLYLANWSRLKDTQVALFLQLHIFTWLMDLELIEGRIHGTNREASVYLFDLSKKEERNHLLDNLGTTFPKGIPESLKLANRKEKSISASFYIGISDSFHWFKKSKVGRREIKNLLDGTFKSEYAYERIYNTAFKGSMFENYKAFIDEKGDSKLKMSYSMNMKNLTLDQLKKLYPKIKNIVAKNFIPYDLETIDFDLGDVQFIARTIFSSEGLKKIFKSSESKICQAYLKIQKRVDTWRCEKRKYDLPLLAFIIDIRQLKKAREKFSKKEALKDPGRLKNKILIYNYLKQMLDIISRYAKKRAAGEILKDLMDPTDYFQFSLMVSNISPFPSGTSKILLATPNKDGFYPSIAELAESQSEAYEIFSDKIVETLENYMYFPEPEFSKNKTENILKEIMSKLKYSH